MSSQRTAACGNDEFNLSDLWGKKLSHKHDQAWGSRTLPNLMHSNVIMWTIPLNRITNYGSTTNNKQITYVTFQCKTLTVRLQMCIWKKWIQLIITWIVLCSVFNVSWQAVSCQIINDICSENPSHLFLNLSYKIFSLFPLFFVSHTHSPPIPPYFNMSCHICHLLRSTLRCVAHLCYSKCYDLCSTLVEWPLQKGQDTYFPFFFLLVNRVSQFGKSLVNTKP